jgi:hypothetical protein
MDADETARLDDGTTIPAERGVSIRRYVDLVKADLCANAGRIDFSRFPGSANVRRLITVLEFNAVSGLLNKPRNFGSGQCASC